MRLIDADKVKEYPIRLDHYDKVNGSKQFVLGVESVLEYVDYLPTVDAIPIEFIKQLIEKFDCERGNAIKDTYAHILADLLEFWEFEQEGENE